MTTVATAKMPLLDIARLFLYVREAPVQNTGQRVEAIQTWCGGKKGDSWCCYFVTMVLDLFFQGAAPIERMGGTDELLGLARGKGWITTTPTVGDVFLCLNSPTDAHHTGFVAALVHDAAGQVTAVETIEGNSNQGGSSNGNGVYARQGGNARKLDPAHLVFVHYPR